MEVPRLIGAGAVADESLIALEYGGEVGVPVEVAAVDAFGEGVNKHRGGAGFQVVSIPPALVDDLPPEAGFGILIADDSGGQPTQDLVDGFDAGMGRWQEIEAIDDGHRIPTDRAAPEAGREAGLRIGPRLRALFVPSVMVQTLPGGERVLVHQDDLLDDLIEGGRLLENFSILGEKRRSHVKSVEPHLPGIALLVPKTAVAGARLGGELGAQVAGGGFEPLLAGFLVETQCHAAGRDHVDVKIGHLVGGDRAVRLDE